MSDFKVYGLKGRTCECGQVILIAQDQSLAKHFGDEFDFHTCFEDNPRCKGCGQAIELPIPETLDADRSACYQFMQTIDKQ